MNELFDIYGYCGIPKNTLLFRGHDNNSFEDCMFFATKALVAGAFNKSVQVWKTTTNIQVLFLVDQLDNRSWTTSSLPQLYNNIFPSDCNSGFSELSIKHWDINRRNKLVRKLFDNFNLSGWLTSLEDKVELEVCLFDKQTNNKQLVLVDTIDSKNKNYYKDSLEQIGITPGKTFFEKTKLKLDTPIHVNEQDKSNRYSRMVDDWIKDEMKNGMTKDEATHYHLNLRTKLKL